LDTNADDDRILGDKGGNGIEEKPTLVFDLLLDGSEEIKREFSEVVSKYLASRKMQGGAV
jgi:hypothetical protein